MGHPISAALSLMLGTAVIAGCGCSGSEDLGTTPAPAKVEAPARAGLAIGTPREAVTRDGLYHVTWMPSGGFAPVNEHFELDVTVARSDEARTPISNASVVVDCQMPDHGHGMLREPRSEALGDGRYKVRGMLLHMGGHWTVALNVIVDGIASTADDTIDL
jgi:hypothetical protein